MKPRTSRKRGDGGAALVEMALVVPFLTILFLGVIQFGFVLREHQIVQNAAREGARFGSNQKPAPNVGAIRNLVRLYLQQENVAVTDADIAVDTNYFLGDDIGRCGTRVAVTHETAPIVGSGIWGNFTYTAEAVFRNLSANPC